MSYAHPTITPVYKIIPHLYQSFILDKEPTRGQYICVTLRHVGLLLTRTDCVCARYAHLGHERPCLLRQLRCIQLVILETCQYNLQCLYALQYSPLSCAIITRGALVQNHKSGSASLDEILVLALSEVRYDLCARITGDEYSAVTVWNDIC